MKSKRVLVEVHKIGLLHKYKFDFTYTYVDNEGLINPMDLAICFTGPPYKELLCPPYVHYWYMLYRADLYKMYEITCIGKFDKFRAVVVDDIQEKKDVLDKCSNVILGEN